MINKLIYLDNHFDGIIATDTIGKIVFFNQTMEKMTFLNQEHVDGVHIKEVFKNLKVFNNTESFYDFVFMKNSEELYFEYRCFLENNLTIYFFRDITTEVKEKKAKKEYFAMLNHDLRSPLATIISFLGLIKEGNLTAEKLLKYSIITLDTANKMNNLMESYLKILKLEKKLHINKVKFSIFEFKQFINEILLSKNLHGHIGVCIAGFDDLFKYKILIDKNLLEVVIVNLVNNAIEASGDNKVEIVIYKENNFINLKVINEGEIPKEIQDKIFVKKFTTKINGNGIGLYSCKMITKELDGDLSFISSNGLTKFTVSFSMI